MRGNPDSRPRRTNRLATRSPFTTHCLSISALVLAGLAVSCYTITPEALVRDRLAQGEAQLVHRDYRGALETFDGILADGSLRELHPPALLGKARALTELGHTNDAVRLLHRAKSEPSSAALGKAVDIALGEAYFVQRDYRRAYRQLAPLVGGFGGHEGERLTLLAAISALKSSERREGERLLARVHVERHAEFRALVNAHIPEHRPGARPTPPPTAVARPTPRVEREPSGPLRVLSRRDWGARAVRANKDRMGRIYRVTVHHTGMSEPSQQSFEEAASTIRKIQRVHQEEKRWADIGYHYIIDRSGRVWEGRDIRYQGAHARGKSNNSGNVGVVLMGNFTQQRVTAAQTRSLRTLLDRLRSQYRLPSSQILTHSEIVHGGTACPGEDLTRLVHSLRDTRVAFADR